MATTVLIFLCLMGILTPAYVYLGYPALLMILNRVLPHRRIETEAIEPDVCFMVSCFNEDNVIEKKILNCLALDYPQDKISFVFISDGSTDQTDNIIKGYQDRGITLIRQEGRLGKTSGVNLAMQQTKGDIVVFSDANAMYAPDAVRALVKNFADESVGYVVGAALYSDGEDNAAANSEDTYWQYEIKIKSMESQLASVVGGDGAIYAIRRELYIPLEREDINDFVNPLQIIAQGYRGVFDVEAKCFEETAGDFDKEGRRKERIVNRSFRGLMKVKEVMNPFRTGLFSLMIISHKLLRWLVPFFLAMFTFSSIALSFAGLAFFHFVVLGGTAFLWLALIGYLLRKRSVPSLFYYPYYFVLVNVMSAKGVIKALRGNIQVTWQSHRTAEYTNGHALEWRTLIPIVFIVTLGLLSFTTICSIMEI